MLWNFEKKCAILVFFIKERKQKRVGD